MKFITYVEGWEEAKKLAEEKAVELKIYLFVKKQPLNFFMVSSSLPLFAGQFWRVTPNGKFIMSPRNSFIQW